MEKIFGHISILAIFSLFCLTTLIYIIYYYPHFFRGLRKFDRQISEQEFKSLIKANQLPDFIIQITTKGGEMNTISSGLKNLDKIISQLPESVQSKIFIDLLTERREDEEIINTMKLNLRISTTIVPESYQTRNETKLKARALQYMNDKRKLAFQNNGRNLEDIFIIHFDAESTLELDSLRTMIGAVLKEKSITIFQGPIFYSNDWLKSGIVSRQMESLRPWNCYECYSLTSRGIPYHLHGSNIIVRGDAEAKIGWDFGKVKGYPVVAEDLFFGLMGYLIFGSKVFGWHGGRMIEQPAFKLQDSIKQRVRWIRGSLQAVEVIRNWEEYQSFTDTRKLFVIIRIRLKLFFYALGFIPSSITIISLVYYLIHNIQDYLVNHNMTDGYMITSQNIIVTFAPMIPIWMLIISLLGAMLWLTTIQIGLYHNLKSIDMKILSKIKEHFLILLITPIATLIDTGVAFFTLLTWSLGIKKAVWEITPKTI